jgi:hypothetical protein
VRRQRIDNADQRRIRQAGQHAGMIAAHYACTDDANANTFRLGFRVRYGLYESHMVNPRSILRQTIPVVLLARRHTCGECREAFPDTF